MQDDAYAHDLKCLMQCLTPKVLHGHGDETIHRGSGNGVVTTLIPTPVTGALWLSLWDMHVP
jgi:hypothetical protein